MAAASLADFQGLAGLGVKAQPFHRTSRRRPWRAGLRPLPLAARLTVWIPAFAGMSGGGRREPHMRIRDAEGFPFPPSRSTLTAKLKGAMP